VLTKSRIYGGGYTTGEKGGFYDPTGLIESSKVDGSEGIVYVAMNYRLGAFGWLSGPTLQSQGTANVGLYDQRLAIEWVRNNIHLFGGDPERITLMGESAGGGSIMHQITAYGGAVPAPFQQAIPQSPGFGPVPSNFNQEEIFQEFLTVLGVKTIEEARRLPSSTLIAANAAQIGLRSRYGTFTYGPVVDGSFVPGLPGKLLLQGAFDRNVKILVSHTSNEAITFTDPRVTDDMALATYLRASLAGIPDQVVNYVINTLYPAVYDGSQPYSNGLDRTIFIISEIIFTCNTVYLARADTSSAYKYQFSVPPGLHGSDVPYTFYNGVSEDPSFNATVARALQAYLTSFAQNGVPSAEGFPTFPVYGSTSTELNLNISGISTMRDSTDNARCQYWQKALYY
jgi:carboxylesterase type B